MEEWRQCKGYEGYYDVSSEGRIRSVARMIPMGEHERYAPSKILAQEWHKTGCWRVRLCVDNVKSSKSVHRLVAQAFIPNSLGLPEVNHKDGSRKNNKADNLEWVNKQQNMRHAVETGLINNPFRSKARHFTGAVQVINKNGEVIDTLFGNKDMLDKGYDFRLASATILGKQKSHRGCTFVKLNKEN